MLTGQIDTSGLSTQSEHSVAQLADLNSLFALFVLFYNRPSNQPNRASMRMSLEDLIKTELSLKPGLIYLNHAAVGTWPSRTAKAVRNFATENETCGAQHYLEWMKVEAVLRDQFAQIINANSGDDIAILKNTSEALSFVAYGLDWQAGDNVVISNQEFPSNAMVWHSLKAKGVEVREVELCSDDSPEDALIKAMDDKTKLLSISSVQYASGLKMDLLALGEACKKTRCYFVSMRFRVLA